MWAAEDPHTTVQSHYQEGFCINIWAGIVGDYLLGPQVLPNRLTGQNYKAFLQNDLVNFLDDVSLTFRRELHFIHDGALAHFSLLVSQYLNEMFPYKWIGKRWTNCLAPTLTRFKPIRLLSVGLCKVFSVFDCRNSPKLNCGSVSDNTRYARNLGAFSNETTS